MTVLAHDGDETFEASAELERVLVEAISQSDRGETIPLPNLLNELRGRE